MLAATVTPRPTVRLRQLGVLPSAIGGEFMILAISLRNTRGDGGQGTRVH